MAAVATAPGGTLTTRKPKRKPPSAYQRGRSAYGARSGNLSPTQRRLKKNRDKDQTNRRVMRKAAARTSATVSEKRPALSSQGISSVNRVTSGPGSQRAGKRYVVKSDAEGNYYHVYGHGAKAKRVKLSSDVATAYGYTKPGGESIKQGKPKAPKRGGGNKATTQTPGGHKRSAARRRVRQVRGGTLTSA